MLWYESLTASRYGKRATLSPLLPAPQDPTEDASMTESFVLTLYFNTLHVRFHVDGLEVPQPHHQSEHLLDIIPKCGDELWGIGSQHILYQNTLPQQQQICSLSFREGELNGKRCVYCPFWSCAVTTKIDGSANIQNSLLAVRKMVISTVKNGRLHYGFSPILFLTLLDTTLQWSLLPLVSFFH